MVVLDAKYNELQKGYQKLTPDQGRLIYIHFMSKMGYEALVLAVMLYGCKTRRINSQTSEEFKCLRSLHRSFCRRMARFRMQSHRL